MGGFEGGGGPIDCRYKAKADRKKIYETNCKKKKKKRGASGGQSWENHRFSFHMRGETLKGEGGEGVFDVREVL